MALDFIATKLLKKVRLVYTIIETIESAISDFVEAKTSLLGKLEILEDLLEGGAASVSA